MPKKPVVQEHHLFYDPEIKRRVYKGEHWISTQIRRRKHWSKGFIAELKVQIALNEDTAVDLDVNNK